MDSHFGFFQVMFTATTAFILISNPVVPKLTLALHLLGHLSQPLPEDGGSVSFFFQKYIENCIHYIGLFVFCRILDDFDLHFDEALKARV